MRSCVLVGGLIAVLTACANGGAAREIDEFDELVFVDQLPATVDDTMMVAEVSGKGGVGLRIVDVGSSTSHLVEVDRMRSSPLATGPDSIWYVDGDGAVRSLDWLGVATDAPPHVVAEGQFVSRLVPIHATGGVALGLQGDDHRIETVVVLDANGSVRCSGDLAPSADPTELGRRLWAFGFESGTGEPVCTEPIGEYGVRDLVRLTEFELRKFVYADGVLTGLGPEGDSIVRFQRQTDGSWSLTASKEIDHNIYGPEVAAGSVWLPAGAHVVRMSTDDLSVEAELADFMCSDGAVPLAAEGMVWVDADCDGVLLRIDPATNDVDEWVLPMDGVSDIQTHVRVSPEGLWYIDAEQSAEPYFFSFERERFERLPDPLHELRLYVLDYELRPVASPSP